MEYYGIKIIGSKKFVNQTTKAIDLIKNESKLDFNKIIKYLKIIKQSKSSGMVLDKAQYNVGNKTAYYSVEWYAGTIIHDTYHYYLHKVKKVKWIPKNFEKHEKLCVEEQIRFLKKIKVEKQVIKHCKEMIKSKYWLKEKRDW